MAMRDFKRLQDDQIPKKKSHTSACTELRILNDNQCVIYTVFNNKFYNCLQETKLDCTETNLLLTEHEGCTGEYWPEVVAAQTKQSKVHTKTTQGLNIPQYGSSQLGK